MYKNKEELLEAIVRVADQLDQMGHVKYAGIFDGLVTRMRDAKDIMSGKWDDKDETKAFNEVIAVERKIKEYTKYGLMEDSLDVKNQKLNGFLTELDDIANRWNFTEKDNLSKNDFWQDVILRYDMWKKFCQKELGNRYDKMQSLRKAVPNLVGIFDPKQKK